MKYYGGIEAGGTKFVCAVSDENFEIVAETSIPTTTPEETLEQVFAFFDQFDLLAMGVGSFGPIGIDPTKDTYGYVLATPKKGWAQYDFLGNLQGHIHVKRHPDDTFGGTCPYHDDCLEGLAAGPSLAGRTGIKGQDLPEDHPIWDIQAYYIAQALMSYTLILAPEIIILGGGVMNQEHLLLKIRQQFVDQMNGYMETPEASEYIVRWGLPNKSGITGCLLLAADVAKK